MRLDWYLPVLRKSTPKPAQNDTNGSVHRLAELVLPANAFSDRATKRRGRVRRSLRKLGISWQAAPVRRAIQTICLLAFLGLFVYSCWPYDARPLPPGQEWTNWQVSQIDQETGAVTLVQAEPQVTDRIDALDGSGVHLVIPEQPGQTEFVSAPMIVSRIQLGSVELGPAGELPAEIFDRLLSDPLATWEIHERKPNQWPRHYADNLAAKEPIPAEFFLAIDPLVSLSTAIASRSWVWSLACAGIILAICIFIPRGFCGYLCPLGTTIDLFDWLVGRRVTRWRVQRDGWWVHIKYYLLLGTLVSAICGVLVSGFFSAIPVITRACLMVIDPAQTALLRGAHLVPSMGWGHAVSLLMFVGVLSLGFLQPRFWCKYVCPSGATFSLGNLFRVTERKVESSCIHCNKCVEVCPFDAIKADFTTRVTDCTLCQTCAGVCPTHAIKFVERNNVVELKVIDDPPTGETPIGRRGFLSLAGGAAAAVTGGIGTAVATKAWGAGLSDTSGEIPTPIRPPGSVPEQDFLEMCIRCGECFKVCPNNVLQVQGFDQGLEGLWTPVARPDWAGCESSCNACGQVCPTGAIRALALEEKRHARMGLAVVNESTCLPLAGHSDCDLCVVECQAAGYDAIEYQQVGTEVDDNGLPIPGTGFLAPLVIAEKCVGCGLCQTRCFGINVKAEHLLSESAIVVKTGDAHEDRVTEGSYIEMHQKRLDDRVEQAPQDKSGPESNDSVPTIDFGDNPFGL
ncbi:MAG TPA: 4Fe-4S ferredoxin [Planctomycetaceae bacterium]|nr:4Fe-4S ferredoxin [Planctomycetaceae bacterium]